MFKTRLISGIILLVFSIFVICKGSWALMLTLMALSLIGLYELFRVMSIEKLSISYLAYLFNIIYYILLWFDMEEYRYYLLITTFAILMFVYIIKFQTCDIEKVSKIFFSLFYVTFLFSFIYTTRMMKNGAYYVWLIFISSWGSDTLAYCSGMLFGKHKIAPVLSPKKSVEGSIGGLIGSALLGFIYALIFYRYMGRFNILFYPAICFIGAIASQMGDFTASAIKRNYSIKDYGHIIPGHGGILDRFDSIIFTAPIIYMLIQILSQ